ncbi:MAG: signal peptidase I [Lachnospiraceae bacterium]|nr:signal peptidase I [Lachnospiraceae bacterium]
MKKKKKSTARRGRIKLAKRRRKMLKKIWNAFTSVLIALAVLMAILLVGVRIFGLRIYTVLSGSMEPAYPTGSVIYVKEIDPEELEVGDVITFMLTGDTVATHRIVEVVTDEENPDITQFRTKGDANNAADGSLVHYENIIGTPVFTIPYLGYLVSYVQSHRGRYVAISAASALLLLMILPELLTDESKKGKKKKGKEKRTDGNIQSSVL